MPIHSPVDLPTVRRLLLGTAIAVGLAACAGRNPLVSTGPAPRVEDCALLQQATPSRYVCPDGKTYAAVQLTDIRDGKSVAVK